MVAVEIWDCSSEARAIIISHVMSGQDLKGLSLDLFFLIQGYT